MQIFNVWEYKVWIVQQQTKRGNALVIITLYLKMQSPIENNDINAVVEVESQQRSLEIEAMIQQLDQECVQELLPKQQALQNAIQYLQQQQNQYQLLQQQQTPHTTHDTVLLQQISTDRIHRIQEATIAIPSRSSRGTIGPSLVSNGFHYVVG